MDTSYLDGFRSRTEVNVVPQVPHSAARFAVMGWADGPASPKQLDRMPGHGRRVDAPIRYLDLGRD